MLQAWELIIVYLSMLSPPVHASCVNGTPRAAPMPILRTALIREATFPLPPALPLPPACTAYQKLMSQLSVVPELPTILVGGESRRALSTVQVFMLWLVEGLMRWPIVFECCVPPSPSLLPPPLPSEPLPLPPEPLPPTGKSCSRRTSSSTTSISPLLSLRLTPVCLPLLTAEDVDALFERFPVRCERASAYAAFSDYSRTSKALEHTQPPLKAQHLPSPVRVPSSGNAFEARGGGGPPAFGASLPPPHGAVVQLADTWEPWRVQHSSTGVFFYCLSGGCVGRCEEWLPDSVWRPFQPQKPSQLKPEVKNHLEANRVITRALWEAGGRLCEPPSIGATITLVGEDTKVIWLVRRDSNQVGLVLQSCDENVPLRLRAWNPSMPWLSVESPADPPFDVFKTSKGVKSKTYAVSHVHDARAVDVGCARQGVCWKTLYQPESTSALQPLLGRDAQAPYDIMKCMAEDRVEKLAVAGLKRQRKPESNKGKSTRAEREKIRPQCVSAFQRSHACICARSQRCAHSFLDSLCLHCCV